MSTGQYEEGFGEEEEFDAPEPLDQGEMLRRLAALVGRASEYCVTVERCTDYSVRAFTRRIISALSDIYREFFELGNRLVATEETPYLGSYVDEDYYDSIRRKIEALLGPEDTYLETFEEDMKYSDTPIAASISEALADIFQPLFNFVSAVRESGADILETAFAACYDDFASYWAQTLCNVLRPLNNIYYTH